MIKIFNLALEWNFKISGSKKNVIQNKFKLYVPIIDRICIWWWNSVKLKTCKFQGNPENKIPLRYSKIEKIAAKSNNEERFLSIFKNDITIAISP